LVKERSTWFILVIWRLENNRRRCAESNSMGDDYKWWVEISVEANVV